MENQTCFNLPSRMMLFSFLLMFLFCFSIQLRIKQHQQSNTSVPFQQLIHQSFFQNYKHLAVSSMPINYTQELLKLSPKLSPAADINSRITLIEKSFFSHSDQIQILANFTFIELDTNQIRCQNVSTDKIQALLYRTSEMKTYLTNALNTNQVNFVTNVDLRFQIKQSIQNQIQYLKGLQQFLASGCTTKVKVSSTFFVSNPNSNNWILGNWKYQNFIESYLSMISHQAKISKCPIENPFYDSVTGDCINCFYPNNIWSMKQNKCVACPYAQIVNTKTRKCVSQIRYISNIIDQSYPWISDSKILQTVYAQFKKQEGEENAVVCPFTSPFVINQYCSICSENYVYSLEKKRCFLIPYHMEYDGNLHKIVKRLNLYQTNEAISSNLKDNLKGCPAQYPYFDNITCINCVFPNYFNEKTKKCLPCFNLDFCGVKKLNFVTNSLGSNITGKTTEQVKSYFAENAQKIKDQSTGQCPIETPYYNPQIRQCMQCPTEKSLFNISALACTSCPLKTYFNQATYICEIPKGVKTYSNATNLIVDNMKRYNDEQSQINGLQCSQILPYFNGKQCIMCPNEQLFDVLLKKCTTCPDQTSYDNVMMKCDKIKYKTNSLTDRLWIDNIVAYQTAYKSNPGKQCPVNTPFFNGTACINCQESEIFNTSSLRCTKCPNGTVFDNINKGCSQSKLKIYVPGKIDNLLGTPSYTADKYLKQLTDLNQTIYSVTKCADNQNSRKTGCLKCSADYPYFNVKTLVCVNCKNFNKDKNFCFDNMTNVTNTINSDLMLGQASGDVSAYIQTQQTKLKQTPDLYLSCPEDQPYFISGLCQYCQKYFNVTSGQCTKCEFFDSTSKTCNSNKTQISNLKYGVPPYYSKNVTKLLGDYNQAIKGGADTCPFVTPFYNGRECIVCSKSDQYFNLDLKKCENCTVSYKLNPIINQCQQEPPKYYTPLESSKLVFDGQPISYYEYKIEQYKKSKSEPCTKDKPYYTASNQCQVCASPTEYFNLLRKICTKCPANSTYVAEDHECESAIGDIVTPEATLEKSLANLFT